MAPPNLRTFEKKVFEKVGQDEDLSKDLHRFMTDLRLKRQFVFGRRHEIPLFKAESAFKNPRKLINVLQMAIKESRESKR